MSQTTTLSVTAVDPQEGSTARRAAGSVVAHTSGLGPASSARAAGWAALVETTKPRITRLVVITSGVGFGLSALMAGEGSAWPRAWSLSWALLAGLACLLGTALTSAGANSLNQLMERDRDARMPRTRTRPLPENRASVAGVAGVGVACVALGVAVLWSVCGIVPAAVALATVLIYLLIYTPMKPITPLATLVGAVPGALPPLIGWTAGAGPGAAASLQEMGGWALFLLMFVWQIPHFLAIAWMYRADYAAGGYRVLPVVEFESGGVGSWTSATIFAWALLLVPVTIVPAMALPHGVGWVSIAVASVSGAVFVRLAWRLTRTRDVASARRVFLASILHLPLILTVMVAESGVSAVIGSYSRSL